MKSEENTYFDEIDNSHKAYWIGFLWADGYIWERTRGKNTHEYGMKLDLVDSEYDFLMKFKTDLGIHTELKTYEHYAGFDSDKSICRCSYYNKHMVMTLMNKYGIIPHRTDSTLLLNNIPKEYERDFIRGLLDADGSFTHYKTKDRNRIDDKFDISFGATEQILCFVWKHLKENNIISSDKMLKTYKRHKDRDGSYVSIIFCGRKQVGRILHYLYDNTDIYIPRKYQKFQDMKEFFND